MGTPSGPLPIPSRRPRSMDVECFRCGAFNLPENKVCGRCGANLPLIYDEAGKVMNWTEDPYFKSVVGRPKGAFRSSPQSTRMFLRYGVIFVALVIALWLLKHK